MIDIDKELRKQFGKSCGKKANNGICCLSSDKEQKVCEYTKYFREGHQERCYSRHLEIKIKDIHKAVEELINPYPKEMFIERTKEEWKYYHKVLKDNNISGTGINGNIGRMCFNNIKSELKQTIENKIKGK
jgi:hypothetical protein